MMNFRIDDVLGDIREDIKDIRKFIDLQKYHQFQQTERIQQHSKNRSQKVNVIPRSQLHYDEGNGVVGRGGFGTVVKGKYAGGPVAIKILSRARATGREVERELLKEAQVMQRISHPLVVRLYGVVNERTEKCLVIELALGSLHDLLYSDRRVLQDRLMDPPDRFRQPSSDRGSKYLLGFNLALLADSASGLDFLHSIGVLHRDIKPANVLIFQGLHCKLCDFGLSKIKDRTIELSSAETGGVKGTPAYLAPELFNKVRSSKASDVYSLGIMVSIYLLTADRP